MYSIMIDKIDKLDEKIELGCGELYVDNKAIMGLLGSSIDYQEDDLSSKFIFSNPNIRGSCGCGESFIV